MVSTMPSARAGDLGVLEEQLVEIAHPVEQQAIRIGRLDLDVLLHHRRDAARRSGGGRRAETSGGVHAADASRGEGRISSARAVDAQQTIVSRRAPAERRISASRRRSNARHDVSADSDEPSRPGLALRCYFTSFRPVSFSRLP